MNESEWITRKQRIDTKLRAVQPVWNIIPYREEMELGTLHQCAVEEFPTANGPADYALFADGQLLGIIEAKKVGVNPQNVLEQAKRYARGVFQGVGNWDGLRVPFLYATNGENIWHLDVRDEKRTSRKIKQFHTATALQEFWARDHRTAIEWLRTTPHNQIDRLRYYQKDALASIESALINGRREMLVAMATGSGKTYTTVSQIYRLLESKYARRVLFLVDRKALAAQAVREFASFSTPTGNKFNQEYEVYSQSFRKEDFGDDEPFDPNVLPNDYLTNPNSTHTFVYVSTIQRMAINLFGREQMFGQKVSDPDSEEDASTLNIPVHAFDVIIVDECHRGYTAQETSIWRDVISHFDAVRIGLTATPAPHTTAIFGEPIFRYTVERAILDGYLVDYEARVINSNIRMNGVFLREGESVHRIDTSTGEEIFDELEDERTFSSDEIERSITAPDSNRKIIEEVAKYAYQHEEETGRFPKILIYAVNDIQHVSHADQLVRICREVFDQGDEFVQKITGNPNVDRPLQKIRAFRNRPEPKVVVSVDMLTTGVDIPALEFIVFLRPVKSRILWVQMLGRGTRRCDEINKNRFTIFDCFDGTLIRYFANTNDFRIEPPTKEPTPLPQVIENIWQNVDREYHINLLVKRLHRIEKNMSGNAREAFADFIPDGDISRFAKQLPHLIRTDFTPTLSLLRRPEFQALLINYERAKSDFLVAIGAEDIVTSHVVTRFGSYQKPEDYLDAFSRFVSANADQIDALGILLRRPRSWKTEALIELRQKLRENRYDEKQLREAHRIVYRKALADVISMVKHAVKGDEPILTAEERVARAMKRLTEGQTFTEDQQRWLMLIHDHLIENLTISEEDFDLMPIFTNRGGRGRARKIFGDQLPTLIADLNYAIAV